MSTESCEAIAKIRRRFQRMSKKKVLFLDETHVRISDAPTTTLVAPGGNSYVIVDDTTSYAHRYDMIACIAGDQVLPPIIYSPNERERGINARMLIDHINNLLAQACGALDRYPLYLLMDRSTIHNTENILQAFHDWGCQELAEVVLIPTQSAKRLSPLDNSLFHDWKEKVRASAPLQDGNIKGIMAAEWEQMAEPRIKQHYKHCGLIRGTDPYFDCPEPASHQHRG